MRIEILSMVASQSLDTVS